MKTKLYTGNNTVIMISETLTGYDPDYFYEIKEHNVYNSVSLLNMTRMFIAVYSQMITIKVFP